MIDSNLRLTSLDSLHSLTSVQGGVVISQNPVLPTLLGFDSITTISGGLTISKNALLMDVSALRSVHTFLSGDLIVSSNPVLPSISDWVGFSHVTAISGSLILSDLPALESFTSFASITSVGVNCVISELPLITSLSGLRDIRSIGSALVIDSNLMLQSLDGLQRLNFVPSLQITRNPSVADVNALSSFSAFPIVFNISDLCCPPASFFDLLSSNSFTVNNFVPCKDCFSLTAVEPAVGPISGGISITITVSGPVETSDVLIAFGDPTGYTVPVTCRAAAGVVSCILPAVTTSRNVTLWFASTDKPNQPFTPSSIQFQSSSLLFGPE